jgi:glycosyltransferase 2 family protein
LLTRALTAQQVTYAQISTVFPIGLLSLVLPIAPSGFGVGHLAFDRLFSIVGLHDGATVFNVFLLGQIMPNVVGLLPYLALRSELPTELPATATATATATDATKDQPGV